MARRSTPTQPMDGDFGGRIRSLYRRLHWKQERSAARKEIRKVYRDMGLETEEERHNWSLDGGEDFVSPRERAVIKMIHEIFADTLSPRERAILKTMGTDDELETIDWDVKIEQLPPRRSEQVVVRFIQGSYRKPRIVTEP